MNSRGLFKLFGGSTLAAGLVGAGVGIGTSLNNKTEENPLIPQDEPKYTPLVVSAGDATKEMYLDIEKLTRGNVPWDFSVFDSKTQKWCTFSYNTNFIDVFVWGQNDKCEVGKKAEDFDEYQDGSIDLPS